MASTIAAVTTSGGGVVTTADASGDLNLLAGTTTVVALTTAGAAVSGTLGVTGVATLGNGAILGTPASGTVTNLTGTASININGTVGATTPAAGSFTTLAASDNLTFFKTTGNITQTLKSPAAGSTTLDLLEANAALYGGRFRYNGTDVQISTLNNNTEYVALTLTRTTGAVTANYGLAVTGTISATGNTTVGFTGGTALLTGVATSNGFISHFMQNDSTGNAAVTRFSLGNNTSTGAAQFLVYGGNHATLPNVVDLNNANNAALRLLANNAVVAQVNPTGLAVTGTLSSTGAVTISPTNGAAIATYVATNTGGSLYVGLDDSTGASFSGVAYASLLWRNQNKPLIVGVNNTTIANFSSTGLAVTGALSSTGTGEIQSYLRVGTSVPTTGLSAGDIALPNNRAVRGTSSAGSSSSQLVWVDANNVQHAGDGNANVGIAVPSIPAATFAANNINYAGAIAVDATNTTRLVFYAANGTRYYLTGTAF